MNSELELSTMWHIIVIFIFGIIFHTASISGSFLNLNFDKKDKENIWHYFLSDVIFPEKNLENCMINFYIDSKIIRLKLLLVGGWLLKGHFLPH